jgi:sugar lactone lactonase YvrE
MTFDLSSDQRRGSHMPVRPRLVRRVAAVTAVAALTSVPVLSDVADAAPPPAGKVFPKIVPLPRGFQPEGIARDGLTLFSGSLVDGDIYAASIVTGEGEVLIDAPAGRAAVGMTVDRRHRLFVAGGSAGAAYVYDVRQGRPLADFRLGTPGAGFINDVTVTPTAAWFTDSFRPVLHRVLIGPAGALPASGSAAEEVALTGPAADDVVAGQFNLNGIASSPDGRTLVVVNSTTGGLYRVDAATGASERIDLGGATVVNGDGLVLAGRSLFVVQNFDERLTRIELSGDLRRGRVVGAITDPAFRIPTTAVAFANSLYAVNARFDVAPPPAPGTPPSPDVEFEAVRVPMAVNVPAT